MLIIQIAPDTEIRLDAECASGALSMLEFYDLLSLAFQSQDVVQHLMFGTFPLTPEPPLQAAA